MKVLQKMMRYVKKHIVIIAFSLLYPVALIIDRYVFGGSINEDGINERVLFVVFAAPVVVFIAVMLFFAFIKPLLRKK